MRPTKWRIRRIHDGFWRIETWSYLQGAYVTISVAKSGKRAIEVFAAGGYVYTT